MLQDIQKDVRYGIRNLLRDRGFTAIALMTLALGIGAATAMFRVLDAVLLRPLPYRDPGRLVSFFEDLGKLGYPRTRVSPPVYLDLKAQTRVFEDVAAVNETGFNLSGNTGGARQLNGALVTYNIFSILGAKPVRGTAFLPEEDRPGANHVVLLSYSLWQSEFAGNAGIIGQAIRLNDEPYTVKGIMPPGFSFPDKERNTIDVWTPRAFTSEELTARRARYLIVVGSLRPGVSLEEANADLRVLASQDARQYPNDMRGVSRFFAEPLQESYTHDAKRGLMMLMMAVGLILLIACANVANLLLARAAARRREITLRTALGASTGRILRQLLAESVLLSVIGGAMGTGVAVGSFTFLKRLIPEDLAHASSLTFNLPVFGFAILVSLACSFLFGLAPALQASKVDLKEALREGGRGSAGARQRLGGVFVAGEVALSLVLLVCAGLLLKSLSKLQHIDPGFQASHLLTLDFDLAEPKYRDWTRRISFLERVLEQARALPGVQSAGLAGGLPFTSKGGLREEVTPEGTSAWNEVSGNAIYRVVSPGYLETLRVPLMRGRFFDARDREEAPLTALVNEKAAKEFWPNQDPIGKRLKLGTHNSDSPWIQVVGVIGDVKEGGLNEPTRHEVYCPYLQSRASWQWPRFLALRTRSDPLSVVSGLRKVASGIDPAEPLNHVETMTGILDSETAQSKIRTILLAGLAALALLMACVGVYGVMAYMVAQRVQEMGVRMALGARRSNVVALVLRKGLLLALWGIAAGTVAGLGVTRLLGELLFEVSPTDPPVIAGVALILLAVALLACMIPACRAASIDPMEALRAE
jgi:putative ABC transport system permease protein